MFIISNVKEEYKRYFQTHDGIENYNAFKSVLYGRQDTLVQTLFNNYIKKFRLQAPLIICDVGGGDGKRAVNICENIHKNAGIYLQLDFIEQSRLACQHFTQKIPRIKSFCEVEIFPKEIEDMVPNRKYDIIFLIHSIFCFRDFSILQHLYSHIKEGGMLMIVTNSSESFLGQLKEKLDEEYKDQRYEISRLTDDLKTHRFQFREESITTRWTVHKDAVEAQLEIILQWLSLGHFKKMHPFQRNKLLQMAKVRGHREKDTFLFSEVEKVIMITKNR